MSITLNYTTIYTPDRALEKAALVVGEDGQIEYIGPMDDAPRTLGQVLDLRGRIVIPGMIDVHVHGGKGIDLGVTHTRPETLEQDLRAYSGWVVENGVTGFLCGILLPDAEATLDMIRAYADLFDENLPGAEALGIFMEGPFLNPEMKGAIDPAWLHDPTLEEAQAYLDAGRGWIRQIAIAPELPNAYEVASLFRKAGVVVALGHSTATYDQARDALNGPWTHITHTFNKLTGLHHRKPGTVGAILESEEITTELIADTIHVHPAVMRILLRCVGRERICLISDATQFAGVPDGEYEIYNTKVIVRDGWARIPAGNLAGSTVTLNTCVRNMNQVVGVSLQEAVQMATLNPARAMGFANRLGSLRVGRPANLAVIDNDANVYLTLVDGQIVYNDL
jgi:N-acetylglucosamine-6-phosphate deacetylase